MIQFNHPRLSLNSFASLIGASLLLASGNVVHAQRTATLSAEPFLTHVVDVDGNS